MKTYVVLGLFAVVLCGVSGCGGGGADGLMKDNIAAMNEVASALDSVKDDASADAAVPKIEKSMGRVKENSKKLEDMKISDADQKKIMEANKKGLEDATENMKKGMMSAVTKAPGKMMQLTKAMSSVK